MADSTYLAGTAIFCQAPVKDGGGGRPCRKEDRIEESQIPFGSKQFRFVLVFRNNSGQNDTGQTFPGFLSLDSNFRGNQIINNIPPFAPRFKASKVSNRHALRQYRLPVSQPIP
jgi:hypothetical protein